MMMMTMMELTRQNQTFDNLMSLTILETAPRLLKDHDLGQG